jgi:acyl-CoA reductase-like NAD-dependent aldehyde dehydrogenase
MDFENMLIGGAWVGSVDDRTLDLLNPATEEPIGSMAYGDGRDVVRAIDAADAALGPWRELGPYARAEILVRAAALLRERAEVYGAITAEESGKPVREATAEWLSAPTYLEFAAEESKRIGGRIIPSRRPGRRIEVTYEPLGVIGVIAAWNFPIYNVNRAVSSALAAGCTVVVRPSEYTPRSALAYAKALEDAGLPAGVLNVVNGLPHEMAQAMLDDARLRKIQFTGSTRVGKILMDGASRTVTRLSLELGGNAPVIVMPDVADLAAVVAGGVTAKYRNGGQACIAPQRFIVHEAIAADFTHMAAERSRALTVGDPLDPSTDIGPLINERQRERVESIVEATVDAGGTLEAGGGRRPGRGYFFEPTVLSGDLAGTVAMTEEIFGPVLPITTFSDVEDALAVANSVEHGLAGFVWTTNLRTAMRVSEGLEFGMVGVNDWYPVTAEAPFGGVKQSGLGRESGTEGVLEYMETKTTYLGGLA